MSVSELTQFAMANTGDSNSGPPGVEKPTGQPPGPAFDSLTKHCDLTNADIYSGSTKKS